MVLILMLFKKLTSIILCIKKPLVKLITKGLINLNKAFI